MTILIQPNQLQCHQTLVGGSGRAMLIIHNEGDDTKKVWMTEKVWTTERKCLWIRPGVKLALRMNEETLVSIFTVGEHPAKTNRIAILPLTMSKKRRKNYIWYNLWSV